VEKPTKLSKLIKRCVSLVSLAEESLVDDENSDWAIDHLIDLRTFLSNQPELEAGGTKLKELKGN